MSGLGTCTLVGIQKKIFLKNKVDLSHYEKYFNFIEGNHFTIEQKKDKLSRKSQSSVVE